MEELEEGSSGRCLSSFPATKGGSYSGCSISDKREGVFRAKSGTLTVESFQFIRCYMDGGGGAVYAKQISYVAVRSCSFVSRGNWHQCSEKLHIHRCETSTSGGGMFCGADGTVTGQVLNRSLFGCKSMSISLTSGCGAVHAKYGTLSIDYCLFDSWTANKHGGAVCFGGETRTVGDCEITKCSVSKGGGLASVYSTTDLTVSYVVITDCTGSSSHGQAIHIYLCISLETR